MSSISLLLPQMDDTPNFGYSFGSTRAAGLDRVLLRAVVINVTLIRLSESSLIDEALRSNLPSPNPPTRFSSPEQELWPAPSSFLRFRPLAVSPPPLANLNRRISILRRLAALELGLHAVFASVSLTTPQQISAIERTRKSKSNRLSLPFLFCFTTTFFVFCIPARLMLEHQNEDLKENPRSLKREFHKQPHELTPRPFAASHFTYSTNAPISDKRIKGKQLFLCFLL